MLPILSKVESFYSQTRNPGPNSVFDKKVLCAVVHAGKIIVGCQYGLLVFWDLPAVMRQDKKVLSMKHSQLVVYEHSAAVSNIYVDNKELITDDYDGVIILR